jgi:hypothetical protein
MVYVRPHRRRNGSYVKAHYRRAPRPSGSSIGTLLVVLFLLYLVATLPH